MPDAGQFQPAINAAATKYGIDPAWLGKLLYQENGFKPTGTSPAGAQGIAQFMPGTAKRYGVDVNDPNSSIDGAAHYLSDNLKLFGGNVGLATAAYNWGEGNVQKWMKQGGSVPNETQKYVSTITGTPITTWAGAGGSSSRLAVTPPEAPGPMDPSAQAGGPGAPLGTPGSTVNPPIPTTPGTTINSTPATATAGIAGQLGQLSKDPNVKAMLGLPDDDSKGQQEIEPSKMIQGPGARNVSPYLGGPGGIGQGQVEPGYAQRMAALNQPMTWGSAPPGQMPGTGYGPQAQPSVYGTSLMSNLGRSLDPMWMNSWGQ